MTIDSVDIGRHAPSARSPICCGRGPIAAAVIIARQEQHEHAEQNDDTGGLLLGWLLVGCGLVFGA